jgi:hypothetical protein
MSETWTCSVSTHGSSIALLSSADFGSKGSLLLSLIGLVSCKPAIYVIRFATSTAPKGLGALLTEAEAPRTSASISSTCGQAARPWITFSVRLVVYCEAQA